MKITFDKEADSLNENVNVDLDKNGKTLGIEILNASTKLPEETLRLAS